MPNNELTDLFYREIFRLMGWEYNDANLKNQQMFIRAFSDKYIYQELSEELQHRITSKAKSSRMAIPPALEYMIDLEGVKFQAAIVLDKMKDSMTISDLDNLESGTENFDDLLKGFLAVPK